jgi:RecB family exonuclease
LREAIEKASGEPALRTIDNVANTAGFRRRLRRRIETWTRFERGPRKNFADDTSAIAAAEWRIYWHYRALLESIGFEDAAGLAVWASKSLQKDPTALGAVDSLVLVEPGELDLAQRRAAGALRSRASTIIAAISDPSDAGRSEPVEAASRVRSAFFDAGFRESPSANELRRPGGLGWLTYALFRDDLGQRGSADASGFWALGAPKGEGLALVVAARLRRLLRDGSDPNRIVVVVPSWDEDAEILCETLADWNIPFHARAETGLARNASVRALRSAGALSADGWESTHLVRLLRNAQLRPTWAELDSGQTLAETAAAIQSLRVFRGQHAIRAAIEGLPALENDERSSDRQRRFGSHGSTTLKIFDRLAELLPPAREAARWPVHVQRLSRIAGELGIEKQKDHDRESKAGLEALWLALEEQGAMLDRLGQASEPLPWSEFMHEVDRLITGVTTESPPPPQAAVQLVTADLYEGADCNHLVLARFTEGTFPRRADRDRGSAEEHTLQESRDALAFVRLVASARKSLAIVYPTTDEKGNELLPAGYFDDLKWCFTSDAWARCHQARKRLDSLPSETFAVAPAEVRLRAVSLALANRDPMITPLQQLAVLPEHRQPLLGVAAALRVQDARRNPREYGPFEGMLAVPANIREIARDFGADRPAFSPSQLETLALCPFQFFAKFVLGLDPIEEIGELEDDRARRGSLVHGALEQLHIALRDGDHDRAHPIDQRVAALVDAQILAAVNQAAPTGSDLEEGLREIRRRRLVRMGRRYAKQFAEYVEKQNNQFECHDFEVEFGNRKNDKSLPQLTVGGGEEAVSLRGKIDRVDRILGGPTARFRVIDYKTGGVPLKKDLLSGLAMQLPLYALALERAGEKGDYSDFGYWGLRDQGYRSIALAKNGDLDSAWERYKERLQAFVIALVAQLRQAKFPVSPRDENCTTRCDFSAVCRIKQVRALQKSWEQAPQMEADA